VFTLRRFSVLVPVAALAVCGVLAASASATPTLGPSIDVSGTPGRIAQGPDGNIWVLLGGGGTNEIAKITPAGVKTEYDLNDLSGASGLTAGSDGNLWATTAGNVVKITPTDPPTTTATPIAGFNAQDIVSGPGGNLWAGSGTQLFKIPPGNPAGATPVGTNPLTAARGIAAGGDGNLWVADFGAGAVVRVTPTGTPTSFPVGNGLQGIAAGPGTQVAATQPNAADTHLARISPGGSALLIPLGAVDPFGITFGSDSAYWVAQFAGQNLGRLTPTGQYTTPITFPANSGPRRITTGPNHTLWVSLEQSNKVAEITGVDPVPSGGGGGTTKDTVNPAVSHFGMSDRTVVVGPGATPLNGTAADKTGTTIRYTLSEKATVKLRIERKLSGRRVKKGKKRICAKPTRKNRKKRKCTRFKLAGTLTRSSKQGKNRVKFTGRIGRKALKVGSYRLVITAIDPAGNKSKAKTLSFRVVKPPRKRR
jgi:streptogramin lyase